MKILIDNGHGRETAGKRSPDGRLLEWSYNREIARRVVAALQSEHLYASLLVPEDEDISLAERCRRVNRVCSELGRRNVCLISIHVNAAGRGDKWYNATGWCCYTSKGQTEGDKLANCLCAAALQILPGHRMRFDYCDGDPDQEANFTILHKTACAACLTENGFMDCKESLEFLLTDEGKQAIVDLHVQGIKEYVKLCSTD
ncbi:MAG: N-acetylmuramoyl-L-alanine amidase [Bacteroidales bacterium]|nr:N-acetylmuramoyl-L-alanine amidase [Bacteroidales bacterium]